MQLSIRAKLITALVAGLVLVAVATAYLMRFVHERAVVRASLAFERSQAIEEERLAGFLDVIMANGELARKFAAGDRAALRAAAGPVFERLRDLNGVTQWTFHSRDPAAGVLLRMHKPEEYGDVITRPSFLQAVETGREASGREL